MTIKFATSENSIQLSALVLSACEELRGVDFSDEGWSRFVSLNTPAEFSKKLSNPDFSILCCVESSQLLGFISIKSVEKIDQLFVIPVARNKGVASLLWQSAKSHAMKNGATGEFWVKSSSVAIPVYQKFGFVSEGEREVFGGISFQLMRLRLNSEKFFQQL